LPPDAAMMALLLIEKEPDAAAGAGFLEISKFLLDG
jgi:hypothetical protein